MDVAKGTTNFLFRFGPKVPARYGLITLTTMMIKVCMMRMARYGGGNFVVILLALLNEQQ